MEKTSIAYYFQSLAPPQSGGLLLMLDCMGGCEEKNLFLAASMWGSEEIGSGSIVR